MSVATSHECTGECTERRVQRERRLAVAAVAVGCLPFALTAVVYSVGPGAAVSGPSIGACPLLSMTGVPCPACGATRAFTLLTHGDSRFLDFNFAWIVIAALLVVIGFWSLVSAYRGRTPLSDLFSRLLTIFECRPWLAPVAVLLVLAVPWAVALANIGSIGATSG